MLTSITFHLIFLTTKQYPNERRKPILFLLNQNDEIMISWFDFTFESLLKENVGDSGAKSQKQKQKLQSSMRKNKRLKLSLPHFLSSTARSLLRNTLSQPPSQLTRQLTRKLALFLILFYKFFQLFRNYKTTSLLFLKLHDLPILSRLIPSSAVCPFRKVTEHTRTRTTLFCLVKKEKQK